MLISTFLVHSCVSVRHVSACPREPENFVLCFHLWVMFLWGFFVVVVGDMHKGIKPSLFKKKAKSLLSLTLHFGKNITSNIEIIIMDVFSIQN